MINLELNKRQKFYERNELLMGNFENIPFDLISTRIFRFFPLDSRDMGRLAQVCPRFYLCTQDIRLIHEEFKPKEKLSLEEIIKLQTIILRRCKQELSVSEIINRYPEVKTLTLSGNTVNDAFLEKLLSEIVNHPEQLIIVGTEIQTLDVSLIKSKTLTILNCAALTQLKNENTYIDTLQIQECPILPSLDLNFFKNLKCLSITQCENLKQINGHPSVEELKIRGMSIDSLRFDLFPKLKSLYVGYFEQINQLNNNTFHFHTLIIEGWDLPSLNLIRFPCLKKLSIDDCEVLTTILPGAHLLSELDIDNCEVLTDVDLTANTALQSLTVLDCPLLRNMPINTAKLASLQLSSCPQLLENHINDLCNSSQNLLDIDLSNVNLTILNMNGLNLKKLSLIDCANLAQIQTQTSTLESLLITNCNSLQDSAFSTIFQHNASIITLEISNCSGLNNLNLRNLGNLRTVKIMSCVGLSNLDMKDTSIKALILSKCGNLNSLTLTKTIEYLELTHLKLLKIDFSSIRNLQMLSLKQVENLTSINFNKLSCLKKVKICICDLNEANFQKLPQLKAVEIKQCNIKQIFIGNSDNIEVIDLTGCSSLQQLNIKKLPYLREITLIGCPNLLLGWVNAIPKTATLKMA